MRAATIRDKKIVVADHPDPVPGTGEVLVRVHAAGLNNADLIQVAGFYPAPPGSPVDIPGLELAGEVVAVGPDATRFKTGDRIMAVGGGGAQARLCGGRERAARPGPGGVARGGGGGVSGGFPTPLSGLMMKRARIHGSTLRSRPLEGKASAARAVEKRVLPLVGAGKVRVPIAATFPLEKTGEAYDAFAAGGKFGKIVVVTR